ncbi:MAG: cytochrome b5-like heme/steroid binding domain-containing protein [Patescibacteria group bacterium]|nr:cytochrome b5-like heme/steroid binding domain-containing protein [Patescibacteria group bacterium]
MKKLAYIALTVALFGAGCNAAQTTSQTAVTQPQQQPAAEQQTTPTTSGDETGAQLATFTLDDVAKHTTAEDCWFVVDGKVYDVTKTVENHPGGPAILKGCGKDATEMFSAVKKHGEKALGFLETLQIGELE